MGCPLVPDEHILLTSHFSRFSINISKINKVALIDIVFKNYTLYEIAPRGLNEYLLLSSCLSSSSSSEDSS